MMKILLGMVLVSFFLFALYFTWYFFMKKYQVKSTKKNMAFECGFLPFSVSRIPFSVRFFFLLIVFVVFDVEISLFLQFPFQLKKNSLKGRMIFLGFFLFLSFCLLEEWRRGALIWQ